MSTKIGFIGFGEVGYTFSKAMREHGADILVYDVLLSQPDKADLIKKRVRESGNTEGDFQEVLSCSDLVLSTVTTDVAREVAESCAEHLKPGCIFMDLNSTSPQVKVKIARAIQSTGADFVEGAILGAVGATGAKTRILTGGEKGRYVAETLNAFGMNATYYSPEVGKASMFKMLRSIFSKGVEAILLELLVTGKRAGIEKDLWEDIMDFMSKKSFDTIGSNWIQSHAVACERRYHEMEQVVETIEALGIEPVITSGTRDIFKQSVAMKVMEAFSEKPSTNDAVVDFIESKLRS